VERKLILTVATAGLEREVPVGPAGFTEFGMGRGTDSALFLNHPTVSRRHCIVRRDRAFLVEDLGSSVRTFRNGQRLTGRSSCSTATR
jgi:pSer/pThr/pTyr-binding forkhead associated (FHA) protein